MVLWNTHLFATVRWQVEHEDGEETDAHAGNNQVDRVEESLPTHRYVEGYIQIWLVAARIELLVPKKSKINIIKDGVLGKLLRSA